MAMLSFAHIRSIMPFRLFSKLGVSSPPFGMAYLGMSLPAVDPVHIEVSTLSRKSAQADSTVFVLDPVHVSMPSATEPDVSTLDRRYWVLAKLRAGTNSHEMGTICTAWGFLAKWSSLGAKRCQNPIPSVFPPPQRCRIHFPNHCSLNHST